MSSSSLETETGSGRRFDRRRAGGNERAQSVRFASSHRVLATSCTMPHPRRAIASLRRRRCGEMSPSVLVAPRPASRIPAWAQAISR